MGIFDFFKKKDKVEPHAALEDASGAEVAQDVRSGAEKSEGKSSIGKDKLDAIIEEIRKETETDEVSIKVRNEKPDFLSSKLGGYPYWPRDMEYPTDSNGKPLVLLAQINLSDFVIDKLPKNGLLQFFVAMDDSIGLNDKQGHKVVYHRSIDESVTEESVKQAGIKSNEDYEGIEHSMFPFSKSYRLLCTAEKVCMEVGDYGYDELVGDILTEKFGYDLQDEFYWDFLSDEDCQYLSGDEYIGSHRMFGYPIFVQDDPRETDPETIDKYDTLLFQLDSEYEDDGIDIEIGDSGIISFFINSEDLKNLNFKDVLYNWDCC